MSDRNIDFQSVRRAGLRPALPKSAENISAARTGHSPMFRFDLFFFIRLSKYGEIDQSNNAETEQECVRLKIADLD